MQIMSRVVLFEVKCAKYIYVCVCVYVIYIYIYIPFQQYKTLTNNIFPVTYGYNKMCFLKISITCSGQNF